jgi:hypothetical protein
MKNQYLVLGGFFLFIVLSLLFFHFQKDIQNYTICSNYKEFKEEYWKGSIRQKFIDSVNHNNYTIIIDSNRKIVLPPFSEELFNFISIDDNVLKISETDSVRVERNGEVYYFSIDFGCVK